MTNMKYCQFENTAKDMADCITALDDGDWDLEEMVENASSEREARAMKRFVKLCKHVADGFDEGE